MSLSNSNTEASNNNDEELRPKITEVLFPYWTSDDKYVAIGIFAVILTIVFSVTYAFVELNQISGKLTDAIVAVDWDTIKPLLVSTLLVGAVTILLPILSEGLNGYLDLRWRTWMTKTYLDKWVKKISYYKLERDSLISNADQRISEDIRLFTDKTLNMVTSMIGAVVRVVSFTILLWSMSGELEFTLFDTDFSINGYMVFAAYLYTFLHLAISHWLGKQLIGLNMHKQTVEADFRHQGMQLRENAEQIAFYDGAHNERLHLSKLYDKVYGNTIHMILRILKLKFGQNAYALIDIVLPTILALPLLFSGKITYGTMVSIIGAYGMLVNTLAFFQQAYQGFTELLAIINRLRDLIWSINKAEKQEYEFTYVESPNYTLVCRNLHVKTPQGKELLANLNWTVSQGERWMIKGDSGLGKSTLLRVIAGLWPYGHGEIDYPKKDASFFIPQKSYIPAGTLKAALCYPSETEKFSDEVCIKALNDSSLSMLSNSLNVSQKWQQALSGGEQQRIAIARLLLHRPQFIYLDEATSALDPDSENLLYSRICEQLPQSTIISVAHRPSLACFHDNILDLNNINNS